jgi:hypothetical protein
MIKAFTLAAMAALSLTAAVPAAHADFLFDAAVGYNVTKDAPWTHPGEDGGFAGPKDTVRFTFTWIPKDDGVFVSYSHVSHLSTGWPVNNKPEDYIDMIEVGYRFNFNKLF